MSHARSRRVREYFPDFRHEEQVRYLYNGLGQEMLAYAQFTINRALSEGFFRSSVVAHFRERLHRHISWNEVRDKLGSLSQHASARGADGRDWSDILRRGTDALPRLGSERIDWVRARAYDLEDIIDSERASRTLLRASRSALPSRRDHKRKLDISTARQRRKLASRTASPAPIPNQSFHLDVPLTTTRQRRPSPNHQVNGSRSNANAVQNRQSTHASVPCTSTDQCSISKATPLNEAQLHVELQVAYSRIAQLDIELHDLKLQEAETKRLWKESCSKYRELNERGKRLQAGSTNKDHQGAMNQNVILRKDYDKISAERNLLRRCVQFEPAAWKTIEFQEVDELEVDNKIVDLTWKLKTFMQGLESISLLPENLDIDCSLLEPLVRMVLGEKDGLLSGVSQRFLQLWRLRARAVLTSLVSAALCIWIFDADVEHIFTNNGIAHDKLIQLLDSAGNDCLVRAKFAVHKLCLEDIDMRDVTMPRWARFYSQRFFHTIKPLLEAQDACKEEASQDTGSWLETKAKLTTIFEAALWIKVRLLLTTHLYCWDFPASGTAYEAKSMEPWIDKATSQERGGIKREVAVAVFPALFQHRVNSRAFSYNRFVSNANAPPTCNPREISRAIVVTR